MSNEKIIEPETTKFFTEARLGNELQVMDLLNQIMNKYCLSNESRARIVEWFSSKHKENIKTSGL